MVHYANGWPRALSHYVVSPGPSGKMDWWKRSQIVRPFDMIVEICSDTHEDNPGHGVWDGLLGSDYLHQWWPDVMNVMQPGKIHQGSANVLFADGHVT